MASKYNIGVRALTYTALGTVADKFGLSKKSWYEAALYGATVGAGGLAMDWFFDPTQENAHMAGQIQTYVMYIGPPTVILQEQVGANASSILNRFVANAALYGGGLVIADKIENSIA